MTDLFTMMKPNFVRVMKLFMTFTLDEPQTSIWESVRRFFISTQVKQLQARAEEQYITVVRAEANDFCERYLLPKQQMQLDPLVLLLQKLPNGRSSDLSVHSANTFAHQRHPGRRMTANPNEKYFATTDTQERNLDLFAAGLEFKLRKLEDLPQYKTSPLSGVLKGMLASTNIMIRIYNKIAINMLTEMDDIDFLDDRYLQLMHLVASLLCDFAYDRELAQFSEKNNIEIAPEYFLCSGADKMSASSRNEVFQTLYNALNLLTQYYSQYLLLSKIRAESHMPLTKKHSRILALRYSNQNDLAHASYRLEQPGVVCMELCVIERLILSNLAKIPNAKVARNIFALNQLSFPFPRDRSAVDSPKASLYAAEMEVATALAQQQTQDPLPETLSEDGGNIERLGILPRNSNNNFDNQQDDGSEIDSALVSEYGSESKSTHTPEFPIQEYPKRPATAFTPIKRLLEDIDIRPFYTPQEVPRHPKHPRRPSDFAVPTMVG